MKINSSAVTTRHSVGETYYNFIPNHVEVSEYIGKFALSTYKTMRKAGMNKYIARDAIWRLLFFAALHPPKFTAGEHGDKRK